MGSIWWVALGKGVSYHRGLFFGSFICRPLYTYISSSSCSCSLTCKRPMDVQKVWSSFILFAIESLSSFGCSLLPGSLQWVNLETNLQPPHHRLVFSKLCATTPPSPFAMEWLQWNTTIWSVGCKQHVSNFLSSCPEHSGHTLYITLAAKGLAVQFQKPDKRSGWALWDSADVWNECKVKYLTTSWYGAFMSVFVLANCCQTSSADKVNFKWKQMSHVCISFSSSIYKGPQNSVFSSVFGFSLEHPAQILNI